MIRRAEAIWRAIAGSVASASTRCIAADTASFRRLVIRAPRDAAGLYEKFGYVRIPPERLWMEKVGPKERWQDPAAQ